MTWQQIETSREIRLWVGQIIVPTITLAGMAMSIPEVREAVGSKARKMKESIIIKPHKGCAA